MVSSTIPDQDIISMDYVSLTDSNTLAEIAGDIRMLHDCQSWRWRVDATD